MRTIVFHLACLLLFANWGISQTFSCPNGSEDMLSYFLLAYPNRTTNYLGPGNANPIYTSAFPEKGYKYARSGYFLWVKSASGYPWDVKPFDINFVYDRSTELQWNDPTTFKRFVVDLPMSPRCVPLKKAPNPIQVPVSNTQYRSFRNCRAFRTQDLAYVVNSISAPTVVKNVGNIGTVVTRRFTYQYGCDSSYANCTDQEVYSLGLAVGLYDWKHFRNKSGKWKLVKHSLIDDYDIGQTTPYLPCRDSYK